MRPLAGHCFIEPDQFYQPVEGGIIISDGNVNTQAIRKKCNMGKVVKVSLYPKHTHLMWTRDKRGIQKLVPKDAHIYNTLYRDIEGKRVMFEDGVGVDIKSEDKIIKVMRLEHILAIMPKNAVVRPVESIMPRCPRCKSEGEANIIMTLRKEKYVCPICQMTAEGDRLSDLELGSSAALDDIQNPERRIKSSKVYSYKGQDKRS